MSLKMLSQTVALHIEYEPTPPLAPLCKTDLFFFFSLFVFQCIFLSVYVTGVDYGKRKAVVTKEHMSGPLTASIENGLRGRGFFCLFFLKNHKS